MPEPLAKAGGWLRNETRDQFVRYAQKCFERFNDRVKTWITMDDPREVALDGYAEASNQYTAAHQLILAHAKVYRTHMNNFLGKKIGQVGIGVRQDWPEPGNSLSPRDVRASERELAFSAGWFLHPILNNGDYPDIMKERIAANSRGRASRLPAFTDSEKQMIKGSADFVGLNYFKSTLVTDAKPSSDSALQNFDNDKGTMTTNNALSSSDDLARSALGLRKLVSWVYSNYNISVYITSNGISHDNSNGKYIHHDWHRIDYMRQHTNQLLKAVEFDGCDVRGYTAWTLADCEADASQGSGLYHVTHSRSGLLNITQKASALWYRQLIQNQGFPRGYSGDSGLAVAAAMEDQFLYAVAPPGFQYGIATSAYQVEGGWDADGKGEHIWDRFSHDGHVLNNDTGDVAADSYHNLEEDLQLLHDLKVDHYRFSIMWNRVMPDGTNSTINKPGVDYYHRLIDGLLARVLEIVVMLLLFKLSVSDYSHQNKSVVKDWITINEPWVISVLGYGTGLYAPGYKDIHEGIYNCSHNLILAHAYAYRLYEQKYKAKQKGQVGIVLNCDWFEPDDPADDSHVEAARRGKEFNIGWFAHPIFVDGDYPEVMKTNLHNISVERNTSKPMLPEFTDQEKKIVKRAADFFGLNHYTTHMVKPVKANHFHGYFSHSDTNLYKDPSWPSSGSDWLFLNPTGFRKLLNWLWREYKMPIVVTENGITDRNSTMDDHYRVYTFQSYINEMLKAITLDGVEMGGYTSWCLLDTFEWAWGMLEKFGVYHIDFTHPNRTRTPKASARYLYELHRDRGFIEGAYTDPAAELAYQDSVYAGRFPRDFSFGVASATLAADRYRQVCPVEEDSLHFDDSLDAFTKDLAAMDTIMPGHYYFTLAWRRLLPSGQDGPVNEKAVKFYLRALELLEDAGVTPVVSLHHWDLPCTFKDGWRDASIVDEFVAFARLCFQRFGDKVKVWSTLHAPEQMTGYIPRHSGSDPDMFTVFRNMLIAHGQVYKLYNDEFKPKQKGILGISLHPALSEAANRFDPNHGASELRSNELSFGLFADPVALSGEFSQQAQLEARRSGHNLVPFSDQEKHLLKGSFDFLGVSYYNTAKVGTDAEAIDQRSLDTSLYPDASQANPKGLRSLLRFINHRYGSIPIYVLGNGVWDTSGTLHDNFRSAFVTDHVDEVLKAVNVDGIDVRGYTYTSLRDDYVWQYGDNRKVGLVDSVTGKPRNSLSTYAEIISDHGILKKD
ncbi:lactase-phlorizin hydrolase [Elysia marginata]|uniref:Lactase-phlorizin hydrolase n=1 Tax=Elysia marginata TaxID=1093978 RepID=A0AAV4JI37_9GAST|nr:lactase-phlorizin hydrolase [Elysia marginata]